MRYPVLRIPRIQDWSVDAGVEVTDLQGIMDAERLMFDVYRRNFDHGLLTAALSRNWILGMSSGASWYLKNYGRRHK